MYPPQGPNFGQHLLPGWENRVGGGGSFTDAFDFSFDRYATPSVVKVVYMLVIVSCVLGYLGTGWLAFDLFMPDQTIGGLIVIKGTPVPGFVALIFGWIPGLMLILSARVSLEHALAAVRTAMDARALRTRYVGPVTVE